MSTKYLNDSGLSYFWSKIKAWANSLFALDSSVVHKTGDELVEGVKTFKNAYHDSTAAGETDFLSSSVLVRMSDYVKGSTPSANRYANILFLDRDGSNVNWGGRLGQVETVVAPSGAHSTTLVAVKNEVIAGVDTRDAALIRVGYTAAGVKYAACPSTPAAADGSANDIVTRDWIPQDTRLVHTGGTETVGGSKTFANTVTFRATTQNCLRFVNTSVTVPAYPPSDTTYYQGMVFYDSAEAASIGSFYTRVQSDRSALVWNIRSFSGDNQQFALTMLSTGESYLTGPTPLSAAEDSAKIPTTEWVRDATGNFACNAATATKLATARNINIQDASGTNIGTALSFDGSAGGLIKLPSTIKASITGDCSGNAGTATKLETAQTLYARLDTAYDSSNPVQFDGSAGKALPVYGTLPVANGGTGSSTKNFVDLSTTQTVGGVKSFTSSPEVTNSAPRLYMNDSDHTKNSSTTVPYASLTAGDKDSTVCGAIVFHCYGNNARNPCYSFMLYDPTESSADTARTINFRWQRTNTSTDIVQFMPSVTALFNLGAASLRWKQLYISESAVSTSDERLKESIAPLPDDVLDAWEDAGFCQYRMRSAVAEKGAAARLHAGLIAQRVRDAFALRGLDASRYGFFCWDEWEADEEEGVPAGDQYSLRYVEALCMEAAYMRRENARLKARVASLEERLATLEMKLS